MELKKTWEYKYPKCCKCDDTRHINFVSPQGRKYTEECNCAEKVCIYKPVEAKAFAVKIIENDKAYAVYIKRQSGNDYYLYNKEDDRDFNEVSTYDGYFSTKEKAEEYCVWKNERQRNKEE